MAHVSKDRVKETTATTGTGTVTLAGAVTGFRTFSSVMATSDTCFYAIVDEATGDWETGLGTLASSTTLARTTVIASSNSNALVSFASGTKNVFLTAPGSELVLDSQVRGGASSLSERLGTISNFASPNAGGVVTGQYYDNSFQGTASSTLAGAANQIDLAPYYTSVTLPIDQIGAAVSTAVASSQFKIVIYDADASGWPNNLLYETAALSSAATGYFSETLSFTFQSGRIYWLGIRKSSTATFRTINVSSAVNFGLTSSSASNYATILRRTVTFANAAPDPWVFTNTDRTANITPPSIRFRAA